MMPDIVATHASLIGAVGATLTAISLLLAIVSLLLAKREWRHAQGLKVQVRSLTETVNDNAKYTKQLQCQVVMLAKTAKNIEDYTRKPLNGIVSVLYECEQLLIRARMSKEAKGSIWFVGLTLGFGPAHEIPEVEEEWKQRKCPDKRTFKQLYEDLSSNFSSVVHAAQQGNSTATLVSLRRNCVIPAFLEPLYAKSPYKEYIESECSSREEQNAFFLKLNQSIDVLHNNVVNNGPVKYRPNIPLQILVVNLPGDGPQRRGCVVFHIGTENIRSGIVRGFYSELPDICDMFIDFAESLHAA